MGGVILWADQEDMPLICEPEQMTLSQAPAHFPINLIAIMECARSDS